MELKKKETGRPASPLEPGGPGGSKQGPSRRSPGLTIGRMVPRGAAWVAVVLACVLATSQATSLSKRGRVRDPEVKPDGKGTMQGFGQDPVLFSGNLR